MFRVLSAALTIACAAMAVVAQAENKIVQHNLTYQDPNDPNFPNTYYYDVQQGSGDVVVFRGLDDEPFEFEALDVSNGDVAGLGDINQLVTDVNATGPISVTIVGHYGHAFGARDVRKLDLSLGSGEHVVGELQIEGSLGELGATQAHAVTGALHVGGDVLSMLGVSAAIAGAVTIDGALLGDILCTSLGDLTVGGREDPLPPVSIFVASGYAGTMCVRQSLSAIDIQGAVEGSIYVSKHVGSISIGVLAATHSITIDGPVDLLSCNGDLAGDVAIGTLGDDLAALDVFGDLSGALVVGSALTGSLLEAEIGGSLTGGLDVAGDLGGYTPAGPVLVHGAVTGDVHVGADCVDFRLGAGIAGGSITVDRDVWYVTCGGMASSFTVGGSLRESFFVQAGTLDGRLEIQGDVPDGAAIVVSGPVELGDLSGALVIHGSLGGAVYVQGTLIDPAPNDALAGGHIIVYGSLLSTGDIWVQKAFLGDSEFIVAANYAGGDPSAVWQSGGLVIVNLVEYTENTPAARVWAVSNCKADTNGDGSVGFDDVNPFILALDTEHPEAYALAFPGLGGTAPNNYEDASKLFHCDLDCNQQIDFDDVDPFVARLYEGCCSADCGPCPGDSTPPSAEELATMLRAQVPDGQTDQLLYVVRGTIAVQSDGERAAFWQAVYDYLTP